MATKKAGKNGKDKTKNDAVATTKEAEVAAYDYGEFAGAGFEETTPDDYAMPFLGICQDLTPAVKDGTVEGAEIGMFINTATNEIHDGEEKGLRGIPCFRQRKFIQWHKREKGGGYVGEYDPNDPVVAKAKSEAVEFGKFTVDGDDLVETYIVYWVLLSESGEIIGQVVTSFKSMFIKKYKNFMTTANQIRIGGKPAPIFSHIYRLKTVSETKPGGTFFNWDIRLDGPDALACRINPEDEMFKVASVLHLMAREGKAKVDHAKESSGDGENPEDKPAY